MFIVTFLSCQLFGSVAWFNIIMLELRVIYNLGKLFDFAAQSWGENLNDTI